MSRRALEWIAPAAMFASAETLRRGRVLSVVCLLVGSVGFIRSLAFVAVGEYRVSAAYALMGVTLVVLLFRVRTRGDLRWPSRIFACLIGILVTGVAIKRGGIGADVLGVFVLLPLAITYMDGVRSGAVVWLGAITVILALSVLEGTGIVVLADQMSTNAHLIDSLIAVILPTAGIVLGTVYEWSRLRALEDARRARDERAQAEAEIVVARADKMATIGMLAAGVGHEVNNPLAYIHSNIDFVLHELRTNSEADLGDVTEALADALSGTDRISKIASDLLVYARADGGERGASVSLADVAESALSLTRHELSHRASVQTDLKPIPEVSANADKLVQVVINLCINAAHAVEGRDDGVVMIRTGVQGETAWLEVSDNGPGVPADLRPKIFDPFFTSKAAGVGTGLGLSVSRSIVESFAGTLELCPSDGVGATFRVTLPLAESEETSEVSPVSRKHEARRRILVVDDEVMVGRGLTRLLKPHEVVWCGSGQSAMALLESDVAFDLILCDVMMHPDPGWRILEYVKKHHPALVPRFVFMTGGAFTEVAQESLEQARVPVVAKPVTRAVIIELSERAVEARVSPSRRHG